MPPPKFNKFTNNKTGKLKKIPIVGSPAPALALEPTQDESAQQFDLEILWCLHQLDASLQAPNLTQKQVDDLTKSMRILRSSTQPIIKKRQLMRNQFGDYRSKMQEEERRMANTVGRVTFQALPSTSKSQFLRKAIIKPTGEEFRFNFQVDKLSLQDTVPAPPAAAEPVPTKEEPPATNSFHYQPSDNGFRFNFEKKE